MTFNSIFKVIRHYIGNKKGQSMVEYILIIAGIALVVIGALTPLGTAVSTKFSEIAAMIAEL